ncbi:GntR family transcriptional regulator [Paenibacillus spongiae]|uniref:GntR family transcriptional regulator n=1 Tax=Paenibacillus spongiae TaxID=2909671 RepID=A0ABY5S7F5_9BACL|nr:GntR family transcriptional regulator [Paenibacillus spongiae]UVI28258.1 GntR family transcriptional regulator [Paenibacillus spongiae]
MGKKEKRTPLYSQVRDYVMDQIRQGKWKEGRRMPSETQLSKQFDVSRITVRGALTRLVEEGVIYRVQGRGTFVTTEGLEGEPVRYEKTGNEPQLIAFMIPRVDNRFTTSLLNGIDDELANSNYRMLLLRTHDSQKKEEELLHEAVRSGVKGIIVYPADGQTYNETMLRLAMDHFPIVVIDRYLRGVDTNCVCSDHYAGAYAATEHLLQLSHREIGFVTTVFTGTTSLEERLEGYKQALADYGVAFDRRRVLDSAVPEDIRSFLSEQSDLTALFAANEGVGLASIRAASAIGKSVPEQLSVVFFDDYDHAEDARIPPTCVSQQGEEIGRQSAKRLFALLERPIQDRISIRVPARLIVRRSTATAPNI